MNTLTAIAPVAYSAAQEVSAEAFAVVNAINTSFDDKAVAKGDKVKVPVAPTAQASDFAPSNNSSTGSDKTAEAIEVEITKSRKTTWNLSGEQQRSLANAETDKEWVRQLLAQGMRTLRNEAEIDAANAIKVGASRAYGSAGTTPFASDLSDIPNLRKMLLDNGAPLSDLQIVMDSSAGLNLRKLGIYQQAYQAGSDAERRSGNFLPQFGFNLHESAGIGLHTKGAGTGYDVDLTAGYGIGDRVIHLDGGTANATGIKAGDVVTFAGDANKYVVNAGTTEAEADISIGRPGLKQTLADAVEMTIGNNYTANLAFERNAIVGVIRPPLIPANPTIKQMLVSDGKGMTYLLLEIAQYGQVTWELHLAWGFKVVQSEHVMVLLG